MGSLTARVTAPALALLLVVLSTAPAAGRPADRGRAAPERGETRSGPEAGGESLYPKQPGPIGYGIFQTMHYKHRTGKPTANLTNPYVAGAEFGFMWAELEPARGQYRWESVDRTIAPWVDRGKKVILVVKTVQKRGENPTQASATPPWVFAEGARALHVEGTNWPVYWDPVYLDRYAAFVKALAARYDGHPGIEFVEIGIGQFGATKLAGPKKIMALYRGAGYTEERWVRTIRQIVEVYRAAFTRTPVTLILSPFQEHGDGSERHVVEVARWAAQKGVYLYHHSLTGTETFARKPYARLFAEVHAQTRTALGPDGPLTAEGGHRTFGTVTAAVRNAIGGTDAVPKTYISYLVLYVPDVSAATRTDPGYRPEFEQALKYAFEHLRR